MTLGAGGGTNGGNANEGGDGGGRVRLVTDALVLDGRIIANGARGYDGPAKDSGGGAGGAVWITTGSLSGGGSIAADGADATADNAGNSPGGGGRVAIDYTTMVVDMRERVTALPGSGQPGRSAGPGTVFLNGPGGDATFVIDDGGRGAVASRAFAYDPSSDPAVTGARLVLRGTSHVEVGGPLALASLRLEGAAVLSGFDNTSTYEGGLSIDADEIVVGPDAAIDVSGQGYAGDCSTRSGGCRVGALTIGNLDNGAPTNAGGSHGGAGGGGVSRTFGDPFAPTTLGGGGGQGSSNTVEGGPGGGRVAITAARLELDGALRADGGVSPDAGGSGGAGGSLWVVVDELAGDGVMSALGGSPGTLGGSGGGGGRIAVVYGALDGARPFDLAGVDAYGGLGLTPDRNGGPGTVWTLHQGDRGVLRIDNAGRGHLNEAAPWPELGRVRVATVAAGVATVSGATWLADELTGLGVVRAADRLTGVIDGNAATTFETALALVDGDAVQGRRVLPGALVLAGAARVALFDELVADALTLESGAVLTHPQTPGTAVERGLWLEIGGAVVIDATAAIDVSGRGYLGDCSPGDSCGNGANWLGNTVIGGSRARSGGSYGGVGGGNEPNATYGDAWAPSDLGAGGAYGSGGGEPGGDGGGRVRVVASAGITLDGIVRADGAPGSEASQKNGAGGAGGAIWLTAPTLAGAGSVHADGGDGGSAAGQAGGGGRIALQYQTLQGLADGDVSALPGNGTGAPAGPGTVAWIPSSGTRRLVMDDGGRSAGVDDAALGWSASATPYDVGGDLTLRGTTRLVATSPLLVKALRLEGSAILSHLQTGTSAEAELEVAADSIDIAAGAAIDVDGRGYLGDCHGGGCGSGGYWLGNTQVDGARRSGGSHGGTGAGPTPNKTYGDPTAPTTLGAGGGYGSGGGEPGGDGGGRVHLLVGGALTLDGSIRAQGEAGVESSQRNGSGGAGGSVWIEAASLGGVGRVTVNGGGSASVGGYGGGGGRIALDVQALTLDAARVTAWPGHGVTESGGAGSVYLAVGGGRPSYVIDDGGVSAGTDDRPFGWDPSATAFDAGADLTVRGTTRLVLTSPLVVHDLTLADTAVLTHVKTSTSYVGYVSVTAATVTIGPDAAIDVSQRGFLGDCHGGACGSGGYTFGNVQSGAAHAGGSHGGIGGLGTQLVYDDPFGPVEPGQGGGYGSGGSGPGGDGGGRVRLVADRRGAGRRHPRRRAGAAHVGSGQRLGRRRRLGVAHARVAGRRRHRRRRRQQRQQHREPAGRGRRQRPRVIEYEAIDAQAPFDLDGVTAFGGAAARRSRDGAGTVWLLPAGAPGELRLDDGGRAALAEAAPWPRMARAAVTVTAHEVTVAGTPWFADQLIGTELGVAGSALHFHVIGNGGGTLELDPADGDVTAVLAAGGKLQLARGRRQHRARGSARALADRVEARDLIVSDRAVLTHAVARSGIKPPGLWLALSGAATIAASGAIDLIGRGIVGGCAPGSESCGGSSATLSGLLGRLARRAGRRRAESAPFGDANAPFEVGGGGSCGSGGSEAAAAAGAVIPRGRVAGAPRQHRRQRRRPRDGRRRRRRRPSGSWSASSRAQAACAPTAQPAGTGGGGGGGYVRLDLGTDAFTGPVSASGGAVGGGAGTVVQGLTAAASVGLVPGSARGRGARPRPGAAGRARPSNPATQCHGV
ncbi:MAG: hypothetical protein U1F43_21890 [Myxococcota bacterium]